MNRRLFGALLAAAGTALSREAMAQTHPAEDYRLAAALFSSGRRDEATYRFYRAQYRFRVYLRARSNLSSSGDPALFASLSEAVGRPINEWAFGDVPALVAMLDRVIAASGTEDDPLTPKAQFRTAHAATLAGLQGLRNQTLARREEIRRERQRNGLPNRR